MKTAVLVIDVQNALVLSKKPELYARDEVIAHIAEVLKKAREKNVPVIYVRHESKPGSDLEYGTEGWKIYPDIAPERVDVIVGKATPDAFKETTLRGELTEAGIDALVVMGLQTDFCVNATVKRAVQLGYDVTVVGDAHSTFDRWPLTAAAIIKQHNRAWAKLPAKIVSAAEVEF